VNDTFYKHPAAIVESREIGAGSRIWAFAHVLDGTRIGEDANICDHVFIEGGVTVGDHVTIKSGVQLWEGVTLEDDVFVGPNATFTNDPFPRSKRRPERFAKTLVRAGASIGANATILPGVTVGVQALVGAGAVVTHDVPPHSIAVGNPARIVGYVDSGGGPPEKEIPPVGAEQGPVGVGGAEILHLPTVSDLRGDLVFAELGDHLPFAPKRFFCIANVPNQEVRGQHAHRELWQLLISLSGSCSVVLDDGETRRELLLDHPAYPLLIPPMVWAVQYKYTRDAVLLVLASDRYDPNDYIRDYDEFQALIAAESQARA
jgi:acetyltransferase-like isoleucine patch superfamily enzyme